MEPVESLAPVADISPNGFALLSSLIEGVANLSAANPARRAIFLSDIQKKAEREHLLKSLELWEEALAFNDTANIIDHCTSTAIKLEKAIRTGIAGTLAATRSLEATYRSVALFYKNAGDVPINNVSFMNCTLAQLSDENDALFFDKAVGELRKNYDRLSLRNTYSLLIIPGYLGSNAALTRWAKIASEVKAMLITDFTNLDSADDVAELFERAALTSDDVTKSNVVMTCNWLAGRGKHYDFGEEDDLYVPPSCAFAGLLYRTLVSQVAAGRQFGKVSGVEGVKCKLKKSDISYMEKAGLVPMAREEGCVIAHSARTLYNGDDAGLQTYTVVRVFDYVFKVMIDLLDRRAFENSDSIMLNDMRREIESFLHSISGPRNLIKDFKDLVLRRINQHHIYLDVHMLPYFPAKNHSLKLEGKKGEEKNTWEANYTETR